MPVVATSTIGSNPYLNPNLPGLTPALGELDRQEGRDVPESGPPSAAQTPGVINLKSALSLMEEINRNLDTKPGWLTLRIHSPRRPSLLGANYV